MHATLSINLSALRANYRLLTSQLTRGACGAVVKANAYGLGVETIAPALFQEGCREFFVATLEEALQLRGVLPEAAIAVFGGLHGGEEKDYAEHRITPVLNSLEQCARFARMTDDGWRMTAILHVDTGMSRLGLSQSDLQSICHLSSIIHHLMSHLACANDPSHAKNAEQLARFREALALFPKTKASFANSAGIFLGSDYHFDLARPGCALYGINPIDGANPMQHVATLSAPILQIRTLDRAETVGYGATYSAPKGARIAICALGYADGLLRCLSNNGFAYVAGQRVPIAGRVSMDMVALDVSSIPESELRTDMRAEFINEQQTVSDIAAIANTIGYEIFTRLGERVKRVYV
ncbi:MAG: alanine racemase [Alphaproteobacteria bacterium]|nr:alanine racemase [Alphaproteobacteria bacterium]